jgi:hypothetical protein
MSLRARKRASAVTSARSRLRQWATSMRSNGSRLSHTATSNIDRRFAVAAIDWPSREIEVTMSRWRGASVSRSLRASLSAWQAQAGQASDVWARKTRSAPSARHRREVTQSSPKVRQRPYSMPGHLPQRRERLLRAPGEGARIAVRNMSGRRRWSKLDEWLRLGASRTSFDASKAGRGRP